jgi:hypothetical protein
MSGYADTFPKIKALHFKGTDMHLLLADGRVIIVPLSKFPAIKKLSPSQRKKYHIMAGVGFDFDGSDEVYHISEFLGADNSLSGLEKKIYPHHSHTLSRVAEPPAKYKRKK